MVFKNLKKIFLKQRVNQNLPNKGAKPGEICPSLTQHTQQPSLVPSKQIISGLTGAAETICGLAAIFGSFVIGAVCGVIVVVGILKA